MRKSPAALFLMGDQQILGEALGLANTKVSTVMESVEKKQCFFHSIFCLKTPFHFHQFNFPSFALISHERITHEYYTCMGRLEEFKSHPRK